jgi:hypothetical protein
MECALHRDDVAAGRDEAVPATGLPFGALTPYLDLVDGPTLSIWPALRRSSVPASTVAKVR